MYLGWTFEEICKVFLESIKDFGSLMKGINNLLEANNSLINEGYSSLAKNYYYIAFKVDIAKFPLKFDSSLKRHQDNDMHSRIRNVGGKLYLSSKMKAVYFCRESYYDLFSQMYSNGYCIFMMPMGKIKAMRTRHFAPIAFVTGMLLLLILNVEMFQIGLLFYFSILLLSMVYYFGKFGNFKYLLMLPSLLICHFGYGIGQLVGLYSKIKNILKFD
jgi:hypothetical protein